MKFAITLWIVLFSSVSLFAQVRFAAAAGYNHNTARIHKNDQLQETGYISAGYANFRVETNFEAPLYFTGLVGYNMRGYVYHVKPDSTVSTRIHYVDLAPLLNFHINTGSEQFVNLFAGPVVGIAIGGKQNIESNGQKVSEPMKFSLSKYYGYANIGIQTGLAYNFNKWFIEGTYHLGVSSINNEEEIDRTNIKNRGMSIGIGYWFR